MWSLSGSTIDEKFYFDIFKRHFTQNDIKKISANKPNIPK